MRASASYERSTERRARVLRSQEHALGKAEAEAGPVMDIYDGAEWTDMDIEDLKAAIEQCRSIEEIAVFLCCSARFGNPS
jgi:hypothetical protein